MGQGEHVDPSFARQDRIFIHVWWLNRVVPLALRHAHVHMQHTLVYEQAPDMTVGDAHHLVAKVFYALLDTSLEEALAVDWLRNMIEDTDEPDDTIEVRGDHYLRVFGCEPERLHWYDMCLVMGDSHEAISTNQNM